MSALVEVIANRLGVSRRFSVYQNHIADTLLFTRMKAGPFLQSERTGRGATKSRSETVCRKQDADHPSCAAADANPSGNYITISLGSSAYLFLLHFQIKRKN